MKKQALHNWKDDEKLDGMLIFSMSLNEMLFDFTIDSFKAPALNVHLSLLELRQLIIELIKGRLRKKVIHNFIEELKYHLEKDPVLPKPLPTTWLSLYKKLSQLDVDPKESLHLVDALLIEVSHNYWENLKQKLIETVSHPNKKEKIISLSKAFSVEIENRGFSRRFAYHANKRFFFNGSTKPKKINNVSQIKDFLELFEESDKTIQIIMRGSDDFYKFKEQAQLFGFTIQYEQPEIKGIGFRAESFTGKSTDYPLYLISKEIKIQDDHKASQFARSQIEFFIESCHFINHNTTLKLSSSLLVYDINKKICSVINKPANPMVCKYSPLRSQQVNPVFKNVIEILSGKHFNRPLRENFTKILRYHEAALGAKTRENQLLNLWSSLEGFLPPPKEKTVRINYYLSTLKPILTLTYVPKIFGYVSNNLHAHSNDVRSLINSLSTNSDTDTFLQKTIFLLTCQEFEQERIDICKLLLDNKLLLNRCSWCFKNFSESQQINKLLNIHRKRLTWHLKRIYTTRNLIVHSAQSFTYLDTLVENLHAYIDTLVDYVIKLSVYSNYTTDIGSILTLSKIYEKSLFDELQKDNTACNLNNYTTLLFGSKSAHDCLLQP